MVHSMLKSKNLKRIEMVCEKYLSFVVWMVTDDFFFFSETKSLDEKRVLKKTIGAVRRLHARIVNVIQECQGLPFYFSHFVGLCLVNLLF